MERRTVCWVSAGAASAVAAKLVLRDGPATLAYCETGAEHPDNARFLADLEAWFGQPIEHIKSDRYADTWDVYEKRRYLAGIDGALCTVEMKVMPRLAWQQPTDIHVFGYTADGPDVTRATRLRETYFEMSIKTPHDDNPPAPCARKYALRECRLFDVARRIRYAADMVGDDDLPHQLHALARELENLV